jgi:hypothetical protein
MASNIVGTVVRGSDFFGREDLISQIWEKLRTTNVLLAGPRRFGKTSVLYNLLDEPRNGSKVVHIDLEPVKEPVDFVVTLLDKLREDQKIMNFLRTGVIQVKEILQGVEVHLNVGEDVDVRFGLKERLKDNWREVGESILKRLEAYEQNLVILLDEFSMMIENFLDGRLQENEVREFLLWFRRLRIDPSMTRCKFVVASSVSIDQYLSKLGVIAAFNDFEKVVVGEFEDVKTAVLFLEELFKGKRWLISKQGMRKILELVGPPIPYFIQVLASEVIKECKKKRVTPKAIEEIYHESVLGASCKTYFQHYYDRLKHYDIQSERAAKKLLRELSLAGEIERDQCYQMFLKETQQQADIDGFNNLMSDLENDFYIRFLAESNSFVFFSKILRDWWLRYYSL